MAVISLVARHVLTTKGWISEFYQFMLRFTPLKPLLMEENSYIFDLVFQMIRFQKRYIFPCSQNHGCNIPILLN